MLNPKKTAAAVVALALAGALPAAPAFAVPQDLRSPEARDAAQGRYPGTHPPIQDVRSNPQAPTVAESRSVEPTGFDWVSAGIGAAGGTGLIVVALALGAGGRRRLITRNG